MNRSDKRIFKGAIFWVGLPLIGTLAAGVLIGWFIWG